MVRSGFVRRHAFLLIVLVLAAISCVLVPPSMAYLDHIDGRTMMSLFGMLAVIAALDRQHVFLVAAERVVQLVRTRRSMIVVLVAVTGVAAMVVTNDMALLTMLPLSYFVLHRAGDDRQLAFVFVMQAAAANLFGMLTPFGSPQNMYLYQRYDLTVAEFLTVMAIPFALSVVLVIVPCLFVANGPVESVEFTERVRPWPTIVHVVLFVVAVGIVLRVLPVWAGLVIPAVLLVVDPAALRRVDYGLLATFLLFFIFAGNLAQLSVVDELGTRLLSDHVMLWSATASQVMSNVPAAILFSHFTEDHRQLLVGVNVGGVGTIAASLASLIALRQYVQHRPSGTGEFLKLFTVVNVLLLVILLAAMQAVFALGLL